MTHHHSAWVGPTRLFEAHRRVALAAAGRFRGRGCPADRDDLEQVALIAVWRAARAFDPSYRVPFAAYAHKRAVGACLRWLRVDRRRGFGGDPFGAAAKRDGAAPPAVANEAPAGEGVPLADLAVARGGGPRERWSSKEWRLVLDPLDPTERRTVAWIFIEGLDQDELAQRLGCPPPEARRLVAAALRRIAAEVDVDALV